MVARAEVRRLPDRSCAAAGLQAVGAVLPLAAFYIAANALRRRRKR